MPQFSSFALQFSGFTSLSLSATAAQLLIVESGVTAASGQPSLTATELAQLAAEGRTVVGYVNTSVTDHNRAYWQAGWVTPTGDEPDVGTPTASAPSWLQNNLGTVDFDATHPGAEATLVDYRDPAWRAMVIAQAVAVVEAGFHGVFLDDVARYFEAGHAGGSYDPTLADSMMALVIEVAAAIRAINPAATVIVNSGVYIGGDSAAGTASQLFADYKAAIDGVLIENQYGSEVDPAAPNVLTDAATTFTGIDILALENAASGLDRLAFLAFAAANGVLPYISPSEAYGDFAASPQIDWNGFHYLAGSALAANVLFGLGGDDILQGGGAEDTIYGGADDDQLLGLGGADLLYAEGGDDTIAAGAGADSLYGDLGNDSLSGEAGNDLAEGGAGNDTFAGGDGNDSLSGGTQNDHISGDAGNDTSLGGDGDDSLYGGTENDRLYGDAGKDLLQGGDGIDRLYAGTGDDRLYGGTGADDLFGGADQDTLRGDGGNDALRGDDGNDQLHGGDGQDDLRGNDGNDSLNGDAGADTLYGAGGSDHLHGGTSGDQLYGGDARDSLDGGAGYDLLHGGAGNDQLYGGDGQDSLYGGAGNDQLYGGTGGRDVFVFAANAGRDVIADFNDTFDRINLVAYDATTAEVQAAIRDWNGGVTVDLARLGGSGTVRILDHAGQVIALTLADFVF